MGHTVEHSHVNDDSTWVSPSDNVSRVDCILAIGKAACRTDNEPAIHGRSATVSTETIGSSGGGNNNGTMESHGR